MATVTLTWSNPTTRTDTPPTSLPPDQIMEIDVFDGPVQIGTVTGAGTSFMTAVLSVGVHTFTVVVKDTTGHSSAQSNIASVTVQAVLASPSAVADLAAVLNP